jgi:hypothetical protein
MEINQETQMDTLSELNLNFFWSQSTAIAEAARTLNKAEVFFIVLHQQLGHIAYQTLKNAIIQGWIKHFPYSIKSVDLAKLPACDACLLTKMTLAKLRKTLIPNAPKITFVGELIHTDVKGPFRTKSINGEYYWILFIDDCSGMVWIYFLKRKLDTLIHGVKRFYNEVLLRKGINRCRLRLDNGGEYFSDQSKEFAYNNGICLEPIAAHHAKLNGTAERMNRTILFMERPMRRQGGLPKFTWTKSARHAVWIKCRLPRAGRASPISEWDGEHPSALSHLSYGQPGTIYKHMNTAGTMADTGEHVKFVGYDDISSRSFQVYRERDRRILITPDVVFPSTSLRIVSHNVQPEHVDDEVEDSKNYEEDLMDTSEAKVFEENTTLGNNPIDDDEVKDTDSSSSDKRLSQGERLSTHKAPTTSTLVDDNGVKSPHQSHHIPPNKNRGPTHDMPIPVNTTLVDVSDQHAPRQGDRAHKNNNKKNHEMENTGHAPEEPVIAASRRGTRNPKPIQRLVFLMSLCCAVLTPDDTTPTVIDDNPLPEHTQRLNELLGDHMYMLFAEPLNYTHATTGPEKAMWTQAIRNEFTGLDDQHTWEYVLIPEGVKLLKTKWVFKIKRVEGRETIYRARLVVKGYTQVEGVDYHEIFSPVVRHSTVRLVLAICAHYGLFTRHLDAPKAFVQADVDADIYMAYPQGITSRKKGYCLKLKKSLYGLKQASRLFNELVTAFLLSIGFIQCLSDTCLFYLFTDDGSICIICVYVDDLLLCASTDQMCDNITHHLYERFKVKDLGAFTHILGMEVTISLDRHTIQLGHFAYINAMLVKYHVDEHTASAIPMNEKFKFFAPTDAATADEIAYMTDFPYREMIGSLLYLMVCNRPDISVAVTACAKYCANPRWIHATAVLQIFTYLVGTAKLGITYTRQSDLGAPILSGCCDTDWASQDLDFRKSYYGYAFFMSGGPISWKGLKEIGLQQLSSTSTEYVGQAEASREGLSLRNTFQEVLTQILTETERAAPTAIDADNQGAIKLASNPIAHARHKHTSLKFHFVRELVRRNLIRFEWISTDKNIADIMTKPLSKIQFRALRTKLMGASYVVYPELVIKRKLGQA